MKLNYRYKFKPRLSDMLSIFINLIFVSGFCFLLIVFLRYAIYLWENQTINKLTKNIPVSQSVYNSSTLGDESLNDHNIEKQSLTPSMKFSINNKYFERSLVIVQSHDYKDWFEKIAETTKKVASNLGYYTKKAFKYIVDLSKSGNNFPDQEEKHTKSPQSAEKINEIAEKITQITQSDSVPQSAKQTTTNTNFINSFDSIKDIDSVQNNLQLKNNFETNQISQQSNPQGATLNLAVDDKPTKDTTTYDKIEKSILSKLQETGLNHYDIWLELGQFYQKYEEKEKAKEIFAMVMKHAQGRDKDIARNGLIALS